MSSIEGVFDVYDAPGLLEMVSTVVARRPRECCSDFVVWDVPDSDHEVRLEVNGAVSLTRTDGFTATTLWQKSVELFDGGTAGEVVRLVEDQFGMTKVA